MIESYFTDTFLIVRIITDENGVKTKVESAPFRCRYEDADQLVTNAKGEEVMSHSLLICSIDENIKYTDKIRVLTRAGAVFDMVDKEWIIHNICHNSMWNIQVHELRM